MTDKNFSHTALKIAGVVVLYNPDISVIENIRSYITELSTLYIIDNSDEPHEISEIFSDEPKIVYIANKSNLGIANALNQGAFLAMESGHNWLLTMDQDSKATPSMLTKMLFCYEQHSSEKIGILTPYHANQFFPTAASTHSCNEVLVTMTSGNLLNLQAFKTVGPFLEYLFIDHVDTEYCLRLWKNGYSILQVNDAILNHKIGDLKFHKLIAKTFFSTNHSPVRKYYVYRNGSLVLDLYKTDFPKYCKKLRSRYWIDAFIVLFYEKEKWTKFRMMMRGYLDYKRGIFGKYHD